jgi:CubicO group peptidase (beta-lactamase class C family)
MTWPTAPFEDLSPVARLVVGEHKASPCAVVAAAIRQDGRFRYGAGAWGHLWFGDDAPPASVATPFDLASVTKPFTALTLARLQRCRILDRSEPLADLLPELGATRSARTALDLFASHRAGLDAHRPLYAPLVDGAAVDIPGSFVIAADARREDCQGAAPPHGFAPVYSDLGYLLLGEALARRAGCDLDEVMAREVAAPLDLAVGSARQRRAADPGFDAHVAPTEVVAFRGGVVRGATHDENAWALRQSAAAGHAGYFGDAHSIVRLGVAILEALAGLRPDWLLPQDMEPLERHRPGGSLLAGFDRRSGDAPSSGSLLGPNTFGHLGFTGTSLWMDPDLGFVGVLLTNRVHPTRATDAIRRARPAAYDAMVEAMQRRGAA